MGLKWDQMYCVNYLFLALQDEELGLSGPVHQLLGEDYSGILGAGYSGLLGAVFSRFNG